MFPPKGFSGKGTEERLVATQPVGSRGRQHRTGDPTSPLPFPPKPGLLLPTSGDARLGGASHVYAITLKFHLASWENLRYTPHMENNLFPSQRVKAIWLLWSEDNPITLLLDQRSAQDEEPYVIVCGADIEAAVLMRISETEANWIIKRRAGQ